MSSLFGSLFKSQKKTKPEQARRVVGVDIGRTSIKVVEVEERDDVLTLTTYGEIQAGPYAYEPLGQSVSLTDKQEQSAVIDLFRESAVQAKSAVFTVPLSTSFVTVMTLPILEGQEDTGIGAQVQVEARKYIPVPIKDVTLDWAELAADNTNESEREVLLAAIQNETLNRLRMLMLRTNLSKQPTEIECFSVIRSTADPERETTAIIDMGGESMKLYIARNGMLEQIHRIQAGGALVTKHIADTLNLEFEDAEIKKRSVTAEDSDAQQIISMHNDLYTRPLQECERFIAEYESAHGRKVESVVLTGGVCLFTGMPDFVSTTLNRPVSTAHPFSKVAYPAFMEDVIEEIAPSFTIALGAAMRRFE